MEKRGFKFQISGKLELFSRYYSIDHIIFGLWKKNSKQSGSGRMSRFLTNVK